MSIAFPGYVPDVHTADALDPAWGNAVRDRANQVFTTAALRDAAITIPQVGQMCVLTAAASGVNTGVYVYAGATDGWARPWNMPWGVVTTPFTSTTYTQAVTSATNVDLTGFTLTFTAVANRLYRVTVLIPIVSMATNAATVKAFITDGANAVLGQLCDFALAASGAGSRGMVFGQYITAAGLAAGSQTVKARAQTSAITATFAVDTASQAFILVEDIGPIGAPV